MLKYLLSAILKVTSYRLTEGHCIFIDGIASAIYFPMLLNDQGLLEETPHHLLQTLLYALWCRPRKASQQIESPQEGH